MKKWVLGGVLLAVGVGGALGDELVRENGSSTKGVFKGFQDHRFLFSTVDGKDLSEYVVNVRSIAIDSPPRVSARFTAREFKDVAFMGYSQYMVRLDAGDGEIAQPVPLLKRIAISNGIGSPASVVELPPVTRAPREEPPPVTGDPPEDTTSPVVDAFFGSPSDPPPGESPRSMPVSAGGRKPGDKWQRESSAGVTTISHGDAVDLEQSLSKGKVNVVHFHMASIHSSIRQGNYIETLVDKSRGRAVIRRIDIPDWNAPVCSDMDIRSLPQFWFYSRSGKLLKKLTERFTEADIDAALKMATSAP